MQRYLFEKKHGIKTVSKQSSNVLNPGESLIFLKEKCISEFNIKRLMIDEMIKQNVSKICQPLIGIFEHMTYFDVKVVLGQFLAYRQQKSRYSLCLIAAHRIYTCLRLFPPIHIPCSAVCSVGSRYSVQLPERRKKSNKCCCCCFQNFVKMDKSNVFIFITFIVNWGKFFLQCFGNV